MLVDYDFKEAMIMEINSESSLTKLDGFNLALGYRNTRRKSFKAHFKFHETSMGIIFDYFYNDLVDVLALVKITIPSDEWTDVHLQVSNIWKNLTNEGSFEFGH